MSDSTKKKSEDKNATDSCCGCDKTTKRDTAPKTPPKKPAGNLPKR